MSIPFSELVIKAPFLFVKGFLLGFMQGRQEWFPYFFHRKAGIRRETIGEMVREFITMDSITELCLPTETASHFKSALENLDKAFGVEILEGKPIKSAEFSYSFRMFSKSNAKACKELFSVKTEGIQLLEFNPKEETFDEAVGLQNYAPIHSYVYRGEGVVRGDFQEIMNFYLSIKKSKLAGSILCSEVQLNS